jgi:hypothetical protein
MTVVLCASHQSRQDCVPPGGGLLFISARDGMVLCSDSAEAKIKIRMFRLFVIKAFINVVSINFVVGRELPKITNDGLL